MLAARAARQLYPVVLFDSFFYEKLTGLGGAAKPLALGYESLTKWKKAQINISSSTDLFLIPIHAPSHWFCGGINVAKKEFLYLDSIPGGSSIDGGLYSAQFFNAMKYYLKRKAEDERVVLSLDSWSDVIVKVPKQTNSFDCGLFTCMFAETLSRPGGVEFLFTQKDMASFRQKLTLEILGQQLFPW